MTVRLNGTARKIAFTAIGILLAVIGYMARDVVADVRRNHDRGMLNETRSISNERRINAIEPLLHRLNTNLEILIAQRKESKQ